MKMKTISNAFLTLVAALMIQPAEAQFTQLSQAFHAGPGACGVKAATTALAATAPNTVAAYQLIPAATNNLAGIATTNTTAGTLELTCNFVLNGQSLFAPTKGVQITAVALYYGVGTTAMSSIAAATLNTVAYPASTAAGAAASGTVGTAMPIATVTPTALQLTTTTYGQCFNEKLILTTPTIVATDNTGVTFDQVFTTAGTTATALEVCDFVIYYNDILASVFPDMKGLVLS